MIIIRTEHPSWLSNAYLVADGEAGSGVLVGMMSALEQGRESAPAAKKPAAKKR